MTTWILLPFLLIGLVLIVIRLQRRFIYFPRRYALADLKEASAKGVQEIRFRTSQGNQTAFFWRNADSEMAPKSLWLVFGGNGTIALDWMCLIPHFADQQAAFLLIEYPGYGICEGIPSPQSILENSENAFQALLEQEHWNPGADAICVLGHSLGGAAALQFAAKHAVRKIVVISTFTTMADMVRATIRISLGRLLRHRFNNVASLRAILSQRQVPEINIFHGEADRLVPVRMGRALSKLDPSRIKFVAIPGADHNDVLDQALPLGLGAASRR
jgi:uncharacterized protein